MIAKTLKDKTELEVEEHSTNNTVTLFITGSLHDVGAFAAQCLHEFQPMKFNTQVVSRRPLNENSGHVEWVIMRNKRVAEIVM